MLLMQKIKDSKDKLWSGRKAGALNPREESGKTGEVSYADTHESPGLLFFFSLAI